MWHIYKHVWWDVSKSICGRRKPSSLFTISIKAYIHPYILLKLTVIFQMVFFNYKIRSNNHTRSIEKWDTSNVIFDHEYQFHSLNSVTLMLQTEKYVISRNPPMEKMLKTCRKYKKILKNSVGNTAFDHYAREVVANSMRL